MKIKIQFNEAQLSRPQQVSLIKVLDELQTQNENELVVTPVEFPIKLLVMLDDNIGMMLGWDADKQSYAGLTKPEPIEPESPNEPMPGAIKPFKLPESEQETVDLPEPEPEPEPSPRTIPAAEFVKSEIGQRVDALANAFVKLAMPFDADQRLEIWIAFCTIVFKELLK